jgi:protoporphyrinogen oxidase
VPDNWIYIQEKNVKVGRLQLFHNWSPYMVANPDLSWVGAEYFCSEDPDDPLWNLPDEAMAKLAVEGLASIGVVDAADVMDAVALRMPDAYPAYFGESYERFDEIKEFIDSIENLLPVGRNGMHRYNNQDHSMLSAMEAVACIAAGRIDRERIWAVNAEQDHHEQRITGIEQFTDGGLLSENDPRRVGSNPRSKDGRP